MKNKIFLTTWVQIGTPKIAVNRKNQITVEVEVHRQLFQTKNSSFRLIIVPVGMIAFVVANFYASSEAFCTHLQRWVALRTRDSHPAAAKTITGVFSRGTIHTGGQSCKSEIITASQEGIRLQNFFLKVKLSHKGQNWTCYQNTAAKATFLHHQCRSILFRKVSDFLQNTYQNRFK